MDLWYLRLDWVTVRYATGTADRVLCDGGWASSSTLCTMQWSLDSSDGGRPGAPCLMCKLTPLLLAQSHCM